MIASDAPGSRLAMNRACDGPQTKSYLPASSRVGFAQRLVTTERGVAKHTASIFLRLGLQPSDNDNRRVLAVLAYLGR